MNESPAISPQENECKSRHGLRLLICLLAVIGFHLAIVFPMMNAPTNTLDEGTVLVYPELFSKGMMPQRDFETPYPPGNIWFLAGVYHLYGTDINVERAVGILYQITLLAGIFFLFRSRGLGVAMAGCGLFSILAIRLGVAALAWPAAAAWSVWSLVLLTGQGKPRMRAIFAGIFAGLAVTWRVDIAAPLGLSIAAYCILTKCGWRNFLWIVFGGLLALVPLMIHVFVVTPSVFLDGVFFNPVIRLHGARGLPLDFSPAYTGQLYALVVMSVVSALVVGWMKHRTVGLPGTILFTVGLFALGTYPEAMQRADSVHLTFAALLAVPLLVLTGSFLTRNRLMPLLVMATVIMTIPQMMQFISIVHKKQFGTTWITNDGRTIGGSPYTQRMIDYLQAHSKPSDSLFVGIKDMRFTPGNDVALYHLFPDLRPATYHVEFNPLSANSADSGLAGDIAKSDWVILNKSWNDFREPNASSIAGSNAPNEVIDKKFKLVLAADRYELYKRIAD